MFSWLCTACARRLCTPEQVRVAAGRRCKLRWRADILGALDEIADGVHSYLEHLYRTNVKQAHRLPKANRQVRTACGRRSAYLDNLYPAFRLVVELDGRAAHPAEER